MTVRPLTDAEKGELGPLLRELHAHVEGCAACREAPPAATAADLGEENLCTVGADLYRRWGKWLART